LSIRGRSGGGGRHGVIAKAIHSMPTRVSTEWNRSAVDDLMFLAKQFIQCQQEFRQNGIDPTVVTLAFHYTTDHNMDSILQVQERKKLEQASSD
jgi:hypothetical protein